VERATACYSFARMAPDAVHPKLRFDGHQGCLVEVRALRLRPEVTGMRDVESMAQYERRSAVNTRSTTTPPSMQYTLMDDSCQRTMAGEGKVSRRLRSCKGRILHDASIDDLDSRPANRQSDDICNQRRILKHKIHLNLIQQSSSVNIYRLIRRLKVKDRSNAHHC
jgi:hypothetical protein